MVSLRVIVYHFLSTLRVFMSLVLVLVTTVATAGLRYVRYSHRQLYLVLLLEELETG